MKINAFVIGPILRGQYIGHGEARGLGWWETVCCFDPDTAKAKLEEMCAGHELTWQEGSDNGTAEG